MTARRALKSVNLNNVVMAKMVRMVSMVPQDREVILVQKVNGVRRGTVAATVRLEKMAPRVIVDPKAVRELRVNAVKRVSTAKKEKRVIRVIRVSRETRAIKVRRATRVSKDARAIRETKVRRVREVNRVRKVRRARKVM
jgi:hypothetical protein